MVAEKYLELRSQLAATLGSLIALAHQIGAPEDALRNLEEMMKHVKPKHGDSLVDEFLAERRAMWGEGE